MTEPPTEGAPCPTVSHDGCRDAELPRLGLFQQGDKATLYRVSLSSGKVSSTRLALSGSYDGLAVLDGYGTAARRCA